MSDYRFTKADHDILVELHAFTAELRAMAKPRSLYQRVRFWAALAAAMTANIGFMFILGGPQRVSINAYRVVADYGGPAVWGWGFVIPAVLTALCIWRWHRCLRWALLIQAVPYAAVGINFAVAAVRFDDVVLIGAPMFTWVMIMHGFLSDYARKEF